MDNKRNHYSSTGTSSSSKRAAKYQKIKELGGVSTITNEDDVSSEELRRQQVMSSSLSYDATEGGGRCNYNNESSRRGTTTAHTACVSNTTGSGSDDMEGGSEAELHEALELISDGEKQAYLEALRRCPHLVHQESNPAIFLRFDNDDPWVAAHRLVAYWEQRKQVFGSDRAFRPMNSTTEGTLDSKDVQHLSFCHLALLPPDTSKNGSHSTLFDDQSNKGECFDEKSRLHLYFYFLHIAAFSEVATNNTSCNSSGSSHCSSIEPTAATSNSSNEDNHPSIVILATQCTHYSVARGSDKDVIDLLASEVIPVQVKAIHLIMLDSAQTKKKNQHHHAHHSTTTATEAPTPIFLQSLQESSPALAKHAILHDFDTIDEIHQDLIQHGIEPDCLPQTPLGGNLSLQKIQEFVELRLLREVELEKTREKYRISPEAAAVAAAMQKMQEEELTCKRRQRDAVYARRKRTKRKIEIEVMKEQVARLQKQHQTLKNLGDQLEEQLKVAKRFAELAESTGQANNHKRNNNISKNEQTASRGDVSPDNSGGTTRQSYVEQQQPSQGEGDQTQLVTDTSGGANNNNTLLTNASLSSLRQDLTRGSISSACCAHVSNTNQSTGSESSWDYDGRTEEQGARPGVSPDSEQQSHTQQQQQPQSSSNHNNNNHTAVHQVNAQQHQQVNVLQQLDSMAKQLLTAQAQSSASTMTTPTNQQQNANIANNNNMNNNTNNDIWSNLTRHCQPQTTTTTPQQQQVFTTPNMQALPSLDLSALLPQLQQQLPMLQQLLPQLQQQLPLLLQLQQLLPSQQQPQQQQQHFPNQSQQFQPQQSLSSSFNNQEQQLEPLNLLATNASTDLMKALVQLITQQQQQQQQQQHLINDAAKNVQQQLLLLQMLRNFQLPQQQPIAPVVSTNSNNTINNNSTTCAQTQQLQAMLLGQLLGNNNRQ